MFRFLFRLYIFWLLFFFSFRILFLFYQGATGIDISISEGIQAVAHSFRLDLSATAYLTALPFLLIAVFLFSGIETFKKATSVYHYILIPVCTLLLLGNMPLYQSWGTLINRRAITFIADPVEMIASLSTMMLIGGILVAIILSVLFIRLQRGLLTINLARDIKPLYKTGEFILSAAFIFLTLRGGWQLIPINESAAYFSPRSILNDAATNPLWHLANNISKSEISDKNPYAELPESQCETLYKSLYNRDSSCLTKITNAAKPNIIIILIESFTADVVEPLNGDKGITPFFTSLCDSGLLFTNIYASGRRTDQALPSVFSGFPAQPDHSVMRFTDKTAALPFMPLLFKNNGYATSFYYGGELEFSNMHAFLLNSGFEKITGKDAFKSEELNSKWGAHDEFVLKKQLDDLQKEKQPFFSALLTLTSHEPFEIPRKDFFPVSDEPSRFRNAIRYTDECLKGYFEAAKHQPWYKNTLFILVADHGHILPRQRDYYDVLSHHIPLLFYGDVITQDLKGKRINATGAQHDIPATLLNQFSLSSTDFIFSNDLLNTCRNNFAYTDNEQTLGWITDKGSFTYRQRSKPDRIQGPLDSVDVQKAIAFRQKLYKEFLELGNKH